MEAKFTLMLPFIQYIFRVALIIIWIVVVLLLAATNKPVYRFEDGPKKWEYCNRREEYTERSQYNCTKFQLLEDKYIYYVQSFNLFCFFWVWFFLHGIFQFIFAGVFSCLMSKKNKRKCVPTFLILNSTYTAIRYHIGSIALGSFLVPTVKIFQIFIECTDKICK